MAKLFKKQEEPDIHPDRAKELARRQASREVQDNATTQHQVPEGSVTVASPQVEA